MKLLAMLKVTAAIAASASISGCFEDPNRHYSLKLNYSKGQYLFSIPAAYINTGDIRSKGMSNFTLYVNYPSMTPHDWLDELGEDTVVVKVSSYDVKSIAEENYKKASDSRKWRFCCVKQGFRVYESVFGTQGLYEPMYFSRERGTNLLNLVIGKERVRAYRTLNEHAQLEYSFPIKKLDEARAIDAAVFDFATSLLIHDQKNPFGVANPKR